MVNEQVGTGSSDVNNSSPVTFRIRFNVCESGIGNLCIDCSSCILNEEDTLHSVVNIAVVNHNSTQYIATGAIEHGFVEVESKEFTTIQNNAVVFIRICRINEMLIPVCQLGQTRSIKFDVLEMRTSAFCNLNRYLRLKNNFGTFRCPDNNMFAGKSDVIGVRFHICTGRHLDNVTVFGTVESQTERISIFVGDINHRSVRNKCYQHRCKEREKFSHDTLIFVNNVSCFFVLLDKPTCQQKIPVSRYSSNFACKITTIF